MGIAIVFTFVPRATDGRKRQSRKGSRIIVSLATRNAWLNNQGRNTTLIFNIYILDQWLLWSLIKTKFKCLAYVAIKTKKAQLNAIDRNSPNLSFAILEAFNP